ncbi:zinc finger protein [Cricetulus griseus]|nr:zinc finger protein [Cricetulus griseus]
MLSRPRRQPPPQRPHRCPKAFSYRSKLAAQRFTHSGARPHCRKAFGHRSKLAAHLWTHAPAPTDCPKSFCYLSKLMAHRHTHHATDARPYPCPHCPKAFSFPSKLAAHRLCHEPPTVPSSQTTGHRRCSSWD